MKTFLSSLALALALGFEGTDQDRKTGALLALLA